MRIIIFCDPMYEYRTLSDEILLGICDYVACRTRNHMTIFEIDEKDMVIELWPADMAKIGGLRSDYALLYNASDDFTQKWRYNMCSKYGIIELKNLDELIKLVIE